jgi:hypothetical protein
VEILDVYFEKAKLEDFTKLAAENIKEVVIAWEEGPSIEKVLRVLAKCRHLRKLTLLVEKGNFLSSKVLCDFIMGMKHLTYLRLFPNSNPDLKPLRDKVNEFVLPRRPNFDLNVCT